MTRIVNNCVALVCLCLFWGQSLRAADASHSEQIKWGNESVFNEEHNTLGLFSGVLGGQIVLAGGTSDDYSRWGRNAVCLSENAGFALYEDVLSKPLAYGASITLSDGILCIGGRDSSQCYKDVFLVTMQQGKLNVSEDWPPLPFPLSNAAGALLDNKVYLFGGRKSVSPSRLSDSFCAGLVEQVQRMERTTGLSGMRPGRCNSRGTEQRRFPLSVFIGWTDGNGRMVVFLLD